MDCPHCKVPLIGGITTCPKCKFDITTIDGGPAHKAWMEGKSITRSELEEAEIQLRMERDSLAKNMLLSSCQTLDGYHIAEYFGLVLVKLHSSPDSSNHLVLAWIIFVTYYLLETKNFPVQQRFWNHLENTP